MYDEEQEQETPQNGLIRASDVPALPGITGSVSVNLHELDKMRADHSKAVKLANFLQSKQGQVKVTIVEEQHHKRIKDHGDRYNDYKPRYIEDIKYVELGVDYKNLDDVRKIIREEERQAFQADVDQLNEDLKELRESKATTVSELNKHLQSSIQETLLLKDKLRTLETQIRTDENTIIACTQQIEEEAKALKETNEVYEKLLKAHEELKKQKSLWCWLKDQFTVKATGTHVSM